MGIGTGTAMLISSAVGVAGSVYAGNKQKDAIEEAENLQAQEAEEAKREEQRIFAQQAEDARNTEAETVQFGIDDEDNEMGTYDDFLTPTNKQSSGVGLGTSKNSSGLGF